VSAAPTAAQILAEIRKLYYETTESTVGRDLARAIELLKQLRDEADRDRAAVYMEGLAEMRAEWAGRASARTPRPPRPRRGS
jgi:hypothetical protein